ncbi:unnamed protein product [Macrosiphum euphorbiae]|uniref:Elongin-C n=1 Tax=Macrosiphum euphorbiae TaxID=13131 RepID=A0AAV0Y9H5_9HEMI|nr:unnamed protein product [Macrosiphum euphorbiae]
MVQGSEDKYGNCEGPNSQYIKLISSDGQEFIVKREHALRSGTIRAMLSGPCHNADNEVNKIHLRLISSLVLSKVCMYLAYIHYYSRNPTGIPEFPIEPEIDIELLLAANFLDC